MSNLPHMGYQPITDEMMREQERLRALSEPPKAMSLDKALHVLATVHTRDSDFAGFVVEMGATPDAYGWISRYDYVEAWKVVRDHLHMKTEPKV